MVSFFRNIPDYSALFWGRGRGRRGELRAALKWVAGGEAFLASLPEFRKDAAGGLFVRGLENVEPAGFGLWRYYSLHRQRVRRQQISRFLLPLQQNPNPQALRRAPLPSRNFQAHRVATELLSLPLWPFLPSE